MRKLALAALVAFVSFPALSHAAARGFVAPTSSEMKTYLQKTTGRLVKASTSPSSQYVKFNKALAAKPSAFKKIVLFHGVDTARTAYIPKVFIKGLKSNTAYVESFDIVHHDQLRTVALPLF